MVQVTTIHPDALQDLENANLRRRNQPLTNQVEPHDEVSRPQARRALFDNFYKLLRVSGMDRKHARTEARARAKRGYRIAKQQEAAQMTEAK